MMVMITVGDGSWLDPSTFRVVLDVVSDDADRANKKLKPVGRPHGLFQAPAHLLTRANY